MPSAAEVRIVFGLAHGAAGLSVWLEGLADWFVRKLQVDRGYESLTIVGNPFYEVALPG